MDHKSDFGEDIERGNVGENLLREIANAYIAKGEHGVEVKTDYEASDTGKVFIETQSRGKPGGLYNTDAPWFAIVLNGAKYNCDVMVIAKTSWLRQKDQEIGFHVLGGDNDTSEGTLMPVQSILKPLTNKPRQENLLMQHGEVECLDEGGSQLLARIARQRQDK